MSLLKRFWYYSIGLVLGLVFVSFFFKKKGVDEFCYLPNCRVLKDLRSKPLEISENSSVSKEEITAILTSGNVDFSKSDVKKSPCKIYVVSGFLKDKSVEITLENCSDKVILLAVK